MTTTRTAPAAGNPLVLEVHICSARHTYRVTFDVAPGADGRAAAYVAARRSTCSIIEAPEWDDPLVDCNEWPSTYAVMYPECEHGLSLQLCAGPGHYPMDC